MVRNSLKAQRPVFFTGVTGVGKSIIMGSTITGMKANDNFEAIFMSFSS
jgi:chromosomal replication initiation ATPase DnaA